MRKIGLFGLLGLEREFGTEIFALHIWERPLIIPNPLTRTGGRCCQNLDYSDFYLNLFHVVDVDVTGLLGTELGIDLFLQEKAWIGLDFGDICMMMMKIEFPSFFNPIESRSIFLFLVCGFCSLLGV